MKRIAAIFLSFCFLGLSHAGNAQTPSAPAPASSPAAAAPAAATPSPGPRPNPRANCVRRSDPQDQNYELDEERIAYQPDLISPSFFVPSDSTIELVLARNFDSETSYFAAIRSINKGASKHRYSFQMLGRAASTEISGASSLVKRGIAQTGQTLITLTLPQTQLALWQPTEILVYTCKNGSVGNVSRISLRTTSGVASGLLIFTVVLLVYLLAAYTLDKPQGTVARARRFDPVFITAGADGTASLANLQILFFSIIVFGLLTYILLRTGVLSDLSSTILMLLGIAGVGATAAKAADTQRSKLDKANESWFRGKKWLVDDIKPVNNARWRDLFTSNGEFDVYRYQSLIFSLTVGIALLMAGVNELSTFSIPETLLGILGLSQAVYITGKFVTPASMLDLNNAAKDARDAEKAYNVTVLNKAADNKLYQDYLDKVQLARHHFQTFFNKTVPDDKLKPSKFAP